MNALQLTGMHAGQILRSEGALLSSGSEHEFIRVESAGVVEKISKQREHLNVLVINDEAVTASRMLLRHDIPEWASAELSSVSCRAYTYVPVGTNRPTQQAKRYGQAQKFYRDAGARAHRNVSESELRHWVPVIVAPEEVRTPRVIEDVVGLASDWDGKGSIAPSHMAKRAVIEVAAYLRSYLDTAEVEVDPSDGGVAFRWFRHEDKSLVSVDVRPSGRVIVVGTAQDGESTRKALVPQELQRVLRTVIDAGLTHINARLR